MKLFNTLLVLLVFSIGTVYAQKTISGAVTDENGEAIIGATVLMKGSASGTITDIDGKYSIEVPEEATALLFSYIGYATQEVEITGTTLNVTLLEGVDLEKVVVTALGVSRKEKSLGYASQEVDGDDLNKSRDANFLNTLQGKVAGVQITGSSNLGGSTRILLRGAGSIKGNNQPLFVVDGVPIDNTNFAAIGTTAADKDQVRGAGGYDYGSPISDINPDDIESVNVLKGPAGAALYGDRGSNGVIMITTKKGSRVKDSKLPIGVSINSSIQFNEVAVLPTYQNQYGGGAGNTFSNSILDTNQLVADLGYDGSWGPKFDGQQVRQWDSYDEWDTDNYGKTRAWEANPNNVKDFFRTGLLATNSIALSGANTLGSFRLSYTNTHQLGTQENSKLNRHNLGFNADYKLTKKLTARASINFVANEGNGRPLTGYGESIMAEFNQWFQRQLNMDRLRNYKNPDGTQRTWNRNSEIDGTPHYWDNPFWERYENGQRDRRERLFGNVGLSYAITDFLTISGRAMTDFYTDRREEWIAKGGVKESKYSEDVRFKRENNYEAKLAFNKRFGELISLNAFAGINFRKNIYTLNATSTQGGLNTANFYNLSNSVSNVMINDFMTQQEIFSTFFNASVGFKDFLYADISYRFDVNSTLPTDNNLYHYYSFGVSFIFSEVLPKNNILSFGKFRASYGQTGSGTQPYQLETTYFTNPSFGSNGMSTVPNDLNNSELQPERSNAFETGLDLRFLKGRLGIDFTYYNQVTSNLIFGVSQSASTGYTTRQLNAGKVLNHGIEIAAYGTPVKVNGFRWDLGFNFAKNNNTVLALTEGTDNIRLSSLFGVALEARVGESYGTFVGTNFVYDENGNKLVDAATGLYAKTDDVEALGSVLADFTGGISTTLSYKGISLYLLFDFQSGGKVFSLTNQWGKYSGMLAETAENGIRENGIVVDGIAATQDADGNWVSSGQPNTTNVDAQTHFFANQGYVIKAADIYDASFVKFREARLGYTFPNKMFTKTPFRDVSISVVGRNLAILHKNVPHIDPEAAVNSGNVQGFEGGQLPTERSIGINLNLKF
ncbi:SusC/RagA family TonB-linked outer membrane protein [Aureispira anguillae]|uniref:SusC/RagA family TonB-linked outer membrane protein n=1 Tax=Aureispira anguillae TaxID=2864201 RepID=A0A915YBT7_9BACT|nr:SusC/RagA family TonB-linked outer membrane protein [Aureispira anguillae]BDS10199.1 SusC/RagA family TonB-linked outer membrane protein [Aureispira anguillae]